MEMESTVPPADAAEGACFLVWEGASGAWIGHDHSIAVRIGGGWHFVMPEPGMQVFDRSEPCWLTFTTDWFEASEPLAPDGGAVVDQQARARPLHNWSKRFGTLES